MSTAENDLRKHFTGAALAQKLAELEVMKDPARKEAAQKPLNDLLNATISNYITDCKARGVHLVPGDVTCVLLNVVAANVCHTRDRRISIEVIIEQMVKAFVGSLLHWFAQVTHEEAKTQPGG